MSSLKLKSQVFILVLGLYLVSTGVSYAVFKSIGVGTPRLVSPLVGDKLDSRRLKVDISAPKTEECPINGAKFSKAEREIWETRRPMGVMIENHQEARPQSGLSRADVVYEAVAEGGITRFLGIFFCGASAEEVQVGPVRSARTYFLDWISEYGEYPLYVHVGGANCNRETGSGCANGAKADALGQIGNYGWAGYNDMNQYSIPFPTFWRDYERLGHPVATEHTMYSTTDKLWGFAAKKRGLTATDESGIAWDKKFVEWNFKDDAGVNERGNSGLTVGFWEGYVDYIAEWKYDSSTNNYRRLNGGVEHKDLNTEEQLTSKNVVVAFTKESRANDGYDNNVHLIYATKGTGKALVFMDGKVTEGTWVKKDRLSRTKFLDNKGAEIKFNRGVIWIEIVPTGAKIEY